ncbi:unnamed protein product [Pelagomonas calceolata]|uniref:MYND-type domain-containing protein n=2 Tax=Pelagomonas calceolata TaxID=35677 RepID=A0A8J2SMG7_9STRA|nr:unnamed protein product [Pelagomonas calceolata]
MRPARTMDAIIKLGERLKNLKSQTKEAGFGGEGTGAPPYELTFGGVERAMIQIPGAYIEHGPSENFLASITAMPAYEGKSFEELRLEDYAKGVGPAPVGTPSKPKKKSLIPRAAALFAKTVRRSPSKGGSDANLAPQRGWGAVDATLPPGPPAAAPPPPVDAAALARDAAARRIEAALSRARAAGVPVTVNGAEAYGPAWVAKSVRQAAFPETFADRVESAMAKRVDAVLSVPCPPMRPVRRKVTARATRRWASERVMLRCRRVYFGTKLQRDVTVVFTPSCLTLEWRGNDASGSYIEARIAPSHMTSFDMHYGPVPGADDDEMAPVAIRDFFAIGLRQKPPHLRSVEGWEPTDDWGPRKYVVVVLEGEALATVKREAVPAVVWGGRLGWPAAPVLGTAAAAREFLEGVSVVDAALRGAALRNSLCEAPSARGNMLLKSQAARAIMDDPLLREAAIAGTLTRKMVRKALIARSDTCATEIEVMILKMRRSFKDDIKAGIRTAAKILRTQARQARRLCDVCGGRGPLDREAFPSCGGCGARRYCSGVCQRDDWVAGGHSSVCPWCPNEL